MAEYTQSRWSLEDLFPGANTPEMEKAFSDLEAKATKFEGWRDKLSASMDVEDFMSIVETQEVNTRLAYRIGQYAGLLFSEDTQNQEAATFQGKMQQFMSKIENQTMFFSLWWKELSAEESARFMEVSGEYEYWLKQIRNYKPFTLSEAEEKVINVKNVTGVSAIRTLYSSLTNKYSFKLTIDGEEKEVTRGELMAQVQKGDPELRAKAYQELYRVFGEDGPILGQMYQAIVRDLKNENLEMRGFNKPISARNLDNDIPDDVIEVLLDVAQKNGGVFQRFFKLKANLLKMDKLRRYDIYAPVGEQADKKFPWNEAVNMVQAAFEDFEPKVAKLSQRVFDDNHIDSEVRKGKRGGAFCSSGDPALTPYVQVNFNESARDIATLAHEQGHAIHAMLAEHHNVFNTHSSLPLAETASTFSEMVLTDRLLANEDDAGVRKDILFGQVDDAYATIMRQIFFALFEREAHGMIANDATVDELCDAYMENLKTQFGDSIEIGEEFKWEWVSIPHIYQYPFYVYAYAFAQLLVLALYRMYKVEGKSFIPKFLELLSTGGSKSPIDILDNVGINVRTPEFWQGGFDVISEMIDKLEALDN
jgi:oligoendopeptidase F